MSWNLTVCGFLAMVMIAGGSSLPNHNTFLLLSWVSVAMFFASLWRLRDATVTGHARLALFILCAGIGVVILQLVPLPQSVWSVMGGREFVVDRLAALDVEQAWLPLSLSPAATRLDLIATLPALSTFLAVLTMERAGSLYLALTIVGVSLVCVMFSLLQRGAGMDIATGWFANPNFFAAQLYVCIPLVAYCASRLWQMGGWVEILAGAMILVLIVAIGATGSRFGLLLAFGMTVVVVISRLAHHRNSKASPLVGFGIFALAALVFLALGSLSVERLAGVQSALISRSEIFNNSLAAFLAYLPAGSGFGSFIPAYQFFEKPSDIQALVVNHAHNDWLELLIEGGMPMAVVLGSFVWWFVGAFAASWRGQQHFSIEKASTLIVLALLIHSFADYPLRGAALMAVFAGCCGFMAKSKVMARGRVTEQTNTAGRLMAA